MRSVAAKLLVSLMALLLTLACFEGVFRALDYRGFHEARTKIWGNSRLEREERVPGLHLQYRPNTEVKYVYDSNPRGYFDHDNTLTFALNNHGHRGPDFDVPKPDGIYRIVVLGDSFTFGEGVRLEHIFTTRLNERLRARVSDSIEVVNAGTGAWSTDSEIRYLKARALAWEPDLVLLIFVPNDANYVANLDLWDDFRAVYEPPQWLRRSYVLSFIYSRIAREIEGRRYIDKLAKQAVAGGRYKDKKWQVTLDAISEGNRLAKSRGSKFAIAMFPFMYQLNENYPLREIHARVEGRADEQGIPYLDLFSAFEGRDYADLWVHGSDQHPNEKGHAIAADAIADFLVDAKLLAAEQR
jgi:lysophospholipase L1-like esterase